MHRLLILSALVVLLGAPDAFSRAAAGSTGAPPAGVPGSATLDTAAIHALYLDGEFEPAISDLETARKEDLLRTHADSVFAFKHLGVMYAAQYQTLEKGKSFMYQLLSIEPTVKILDMYASDMIYMIFRNVQEEYALKTGRPARADSADTARPLPAAPKSSRKRWPYWTAGGVVLAGAAGVAAYLLLSAGSSSGGHFSGGL